MSLLLCRAWDELEAERLARIDAEDIVSRLQEQLAEVQKEEVSARQEAENRLVSLSQEYESMKNKVRFAGKESSAQRKAHSVLGDNIDYEERISELLFTQHS